jgi:hypothetical protein
MDSVKKRAIQIKDKINNEFSELQIKLTSEIEYGVTYYYIVINDEDFIKSKKFLDYLISIYDILKDRFINIYADKYLFEEEPVAIEEEVVLNIVPFLFYKNPIIDYYLSNINTGIQHNNFASQGV